MNLNEFKAMSRAISTYEDINLLATHMAEHMCRSFEVKGCSIMLFDERESRLFRVSSYGVSQEYLQKGPVLIDGKYTAFVTGEPVFIENFQNDIRVQYPEAAAKEGIISMLSVPIKYKNAPIGLIRIYNDEIWNLDPEDLDSFCLLAEYMGLVIENNGLKNFLDKVKLAMETLPLRMVEGI
ncbi:GAF domain-containing protein [Desulfobacterales bacterium HSG17]|nr:GAF domain-containing protein [Desulfobacterales bacterium HSG17]